MGFRGPLRSFEQVVSAEVLNCEKSIRAIMRNKRPEYDSLDEFINAWLEVGEMPEPTTGLAAGMVEYHKTPARVVVELAGRLKCREGDVFYDLGCGLGQVVLLVHLMTGVTAKGVEIEPSYCGYARKCAEKLGAEVCFIAGDVREMDLSDGTIFFLFTPFKGQLFDHVMDQLELVANRHPIRVIGYGPCSKELARMGWLRRERDMPDSPGEIGDHSIGDENLGEYELQYFRSYG